MDNMCYVVRIMRMSKIKTKMPGYVMGEINRNAQGFFFKCLVINVYWSTTNSTRRRGRLKKRWIDAVKNSIRTKDNKDGYRENELEMNTL